jgi:protocatechuate 3,4-dioxygenase beta subunit
MDRKKFLITASLAAFSITACGSIKPTETEDKFTGDCATTDDILGPFFRPNAPTKYDMTDSKLEGSRIELKGVVYRQDCTTPLKNALVEVWHCDTEGNYDNDSSAFNQRAKWVTNDKGEYAFKTILPGKYLNGKLFRPAHIHFRITEESSKDLVSQIYFKGDPNIIEDPWASQPKAELRVLPIILEDTKGNLAVNFDIFMQDK